MSPSRKSAPSAVVGLDIGSESIKIVEAKYAKDGISITGLGVAKTPEGAVENEVIIDPKALGAAIKSLLSECGIKTRKCVSSVSGMSQVVVRVIPVPKMKPEELAETMKWEIERQVPFAPNEVVFDFQQLDNPNADPDATEADVLLAVAREELINNHVEALQAAGLQPMAIDIEALAASRALVETSSNGAHGQTVAIVDIGCSRTDLSVFEQGLLTFPSPPMGIAGVSFTREISEALGQTLEQAEVTKKEYAAVNLDGFTVSTLDDFGLGAATTDQDAAVDDGGAQDSEPTQFDTDFSPSSPFSSAFDIEDDEPTQDAVPQDDAPLAAEPADFNSFSDMIDGPVFDSPEFSGGPSFDLGGGQEEDQSIAAGPSFDLGGGDEPQAAVSPSFDLDDGEETPQEDDTTSPSFDLSDTDENADPGKEAEQPVYAPVHSSVNFQDGSIEEQVFQAISGVLMDLANDLRRSLDFYETKYSRMPQRVYLCGGTAKIPHLCEFLSRELGVPVEIADPLHNVRLNVPAASPQYLKEVSPLFSVSIGLAIRDMIG